MVCGNASIEYTDCVLENIARSVTRFSLGEGKHSSKMLPDIWVGRTELYQYQTLDDGSVGWGYRLSYVKPM